MKKLKLFLLLLLITLIVVVIYNYPRLNIVTGFAAKSVCSCTFEANRDLASIEAGDNDINPIYYAKSKINFEEKSVTSTVFGLKSRKAIYKNGIGCVLVPEDEALKKMFIPNRVQEKVELPYPYGVLPQKDSVFENVDYLKLGNAIDSVFDKENEIIKRTRAVLVLYKGKIIAEKYKEGFSQQSKFLGWSMTKSITSAILGVMQQSGVVNIHQNNLFPEWENDERASITLNNLLQMNSGLEWVEDYNTMSDVTKMLFLEKDMANVQLNKELTGKPNESWNYSSGTTNLLSKFIRNQFKTHQDYLDFWYNGLIDKIGMHSMILETDVSGHYVGSSYSWATARDWAKFGQLYLNNGVWNGEQVLSNDWVNYTKKPTNTSNGQYGTQFWLNAGGVYPNVPTDLFSCNGYQGQHVFIIPSKDLVVVRFGLAEYPIFDINNFLSEVCNSID